MWYHKFIKNEEIRVMNVIKKREIYKMNMHLNNFRLKNMFFVG